MNACCLGERDSCIRGMAWVDPSTANIRQANWKRECIVYDIMNAGSSKIEFLDTLHLKVIFFSDLKKVFNFFSLNVSFCSGIPTRDMRCLSNGRFFLYSGVKRCI